MYEAGTGGAGTPGAVGFANAAAGGQVSINPDEAQTALAKIRSGKDTVNELLTKASRLNEQPQLGANQVGNAMATKMATRADGAGSYTDALRKLYGQYQKAEEGLVTAMQNYQSNEQDGARQFGGLA
ncbi:hypothetical protein EV191_101684 [Tamaricihabitans halophyticus]|uniref:Uncharacterized protein n=1 Tax=Tamaricihabitans halophyticus TaxID=1262583 RepID=A0A4R2R4U1_9PSEU|nr:hypothetical protein [Tamaricihabitans halophyticus]TCP56738.1 hypothetical protein EV191_101684 [Tamaricihabitans halophyticus]